MPAPNRIPTRTGLQRPSLVTLGWVALLAMTTGAVTQPAAAAQLRGTPGPASPRLVSPGGEEQLLEVASACPTFSWSVPPGAASERGYELAVLPVEGESLEEIGVGDPIRIERLPPHTGSWTPSGASCFEHGGRYAWSLRSLGPSANAAAEWAPPLFFRLPAVPGDEDIRRAIAVLEAAGRLEPSAVGRGALRSVATEPRARSESIEFADSVRGGVTSELWNPARVGLQASLPAGSEVGFGVYGVAASTASGAAGVVGEASATSGQVFGVIGATRSPEGVAGRFESSGGGLILSGHGPIGEVFSVGYTGTVSAMAYAGSGSGLSDLQWSQLDNVPAGFDDGVDNDTLYQAGTGLQLDGTTMRVTAIPMEVEARYRLAFADEAEEPAIVIGRDGLPLVAFYDAGPGDLRVVHCKDTPCSDGTIATVDSRGDVGSHNAIVLAEDGYARISYYDASNGRLKLARCGSIECDNPSIIVVDESADVGQYSSITSSGNIAVISYYDVDAGSLKVARCGSPPCDIATLDTGGVGEFTSITYEWGRSAISYFDRTNQRLKLATCFSAQCTPVNVDLYVVDDTLPKVGLDTAIATGRSGYPLIVYTGVDRGLHELRVAACSSWSCDTPTINLLTSSSSPIPPPEITIGVDGLAMIAAGFYRFLCTDLSCSGVRRVWGVGGAVGATALTIGSDRLPIQVFGKGASSDGDLWASHCGTPTCAKAREP